MDRLRINPEAHRIMHEFMEAKKVVACIYHGPWLLVNAGVAEGKTVTSCEFNRIDMENGGFAWVDKDYFNGAAVRMGSSPILCF